MNPPEQKPESLFLNVLFNILLPVGILTKLSKPEFLGPVWGLVLALAFPLGYGIYDLIKRKKWNGFSLLGLVSVLLTGGLALLQLDGWWFALKEAAIPFVIGVAVLISVKTKRPLAKMLILNPQVIDVDLIEEKLKDDQAKAQFEQLLKKSTYLVAASFALSAALNFGLARWILTASAGTPEFNEQLGRMTALSFPVIMAPCMVVMGIALYYTITGIKQLTGLGFQDIVINQEK